MFIQASGFCTSFWHSLHILVNSYSEVNVSVKLLQAQKLTIGFLLSSRSTLYILPLQHLMYDAVITVYLFKRVSQVHQSDLTYLYPSANNSAWHWGKDK